ncbi:MAG: T9SS type A sorting domain-containing protein, partial [Nitrospira sp.]
PFNPSTTVSFAVPHDGQVRLEVYNMLGGLVATIADGVFSAGNYTLRVDASQWSSGTYFYRMTAGGQTFVRRMMLLK